MSIQTLLQRFLKTDTQPSSSSDADDVALLWMAKSGWYNLPRRELAPGLKISPSDSVVDVGCGWGGASIFSAKVGAKVVSLDVDAEELDRLKQRVQAKLAERGRDGDPEGLRALRTIVSDCNPIPLPAEHATVVLAMEVLEHVDDPAKFLTELVRIGKPNAQYLITVPDPLGESIQRRIAQPSYWAKPNHLRVFQRDEFLHAVEAAGLVVERQFFYGFYWTMWWTLNCAVPGNNVPIGTSGKSKVLHHWNTTWKELISLPGAEHVWTALENAMPKSQAIIARKPA